MPTTLLVATRHFQNFLRSWLRKLFLKIKYVDQMAWNNVWSSILMYNLTPAVWWNISSIFILLSKSHSVSLQKASISLKSVSIYRILKKIHVNINISINMFMFQTSETRKHCKNKVQIGSDHYNPCTITTLKKYEGTQWLFLQILLIFRAQITNKQETPKQNQIRKICSFVQKIYHQKWFTCLTNL